MLSFETDYMTRAEIVKSTYESARNLNIFKLKYGLVDKKTHDEVNEKITKSLEYIEKIDEIIALPQQEKNEQLALLSKEMEEVNKYSICGKHELKWEVKKHYANVFSLTAIGIELLVEDILVNVKQRYNSYNKRVAQASKSRT